MTRRSTENSAATTMSFLSCVELIWLFCPPPHRLSGHLSPQKGFVVVEGGVSCSKPRVSLDTPRESSYVFAFFVAVRRDIFFRPCVGIDVNPSHRTQARHPSSLCSLHQPSRLDDRTSDNETTTNQVTHNPSPTCLIFVRPARPAPWPAPAPPGFGVANAVACFRRRGIRVV